MVEEGGPWDNKFTRRFGFPIERIANKIQDHLTDLIRAFIAESPFLVMSTADPEGHRDASPRRGKPGSVRMLGDQHLLVPDVAARTLCQPFQNMDSNQPVRLVFFLPTL